MPTTPLPLRVTPTPGPRPEIDPEMVTPGVLGFVIFAVIAVAAVLLIIDMVRRVRRVQSRARARERIAAELAAPLEPEGEDRALDGGETGDAHSPGPRGPAGR